MAKLTSSKETHVTSRGTEKTPVGRPRINAIRRERHNTFLIRTQITGRKLISAEINDPTYEVSKETANVKDNAIARAPLRK